MSATSSSDVPAGTVVTMSTRNSIATWCIIRSRN
jgi:hypothetical protein